MSIAAAAHGNAIVCAPHANVAPVTSRCGALEANECAPVTREPSSRASFARSDAFEPLPAADGAMSGSSPGDPFALRLSTMAHAADHGEVVSPTPAQDLELAQRALDEGDAAHAAHHLAGVLGVHPLQRGVEEAIARWLASVPDPPALVPIPVDGVYRGLAALRAFALHHAGRPAEACGLLLEVQASAPELPFAEHLAQWLATVGGRPEDVDRLAGPLNACVNHHHLAQALLPALRVLIERCPTSDRIAFAAVRAARGAGNLDEALAMADSAYRRIPSRMTASGRALALRAKGDVQGAVAAYHDALRHDPSDLSAWLDIGDICIGPRAEDASGAYDAVLAREPEHPWALPSRLFLRWRDEGEATARQRILDLARRDGAGSRAEALARQVDPYERVLIRPSSSVVNSLAGALGKNLTPTRLAVSSLEAPSTLLVVDAVARQLGMSSRPEVLFGEIPQPDPRVARGKVTFEVWTYKPRGLFGWLAELGKMAQPAVASPGEKVSRAVGELASEPYSLDAWSARARTRGEALGSEAVSDLLATTVHPPHAPEGIDAWDWVFRVQVAAALCLAGVDAGWGGSLRERALMSLWLGPLDWTTTAALIALTEIARSEGDVASTIVPILVRELDGPINPIRWACTDRADDVASRQGPYRRR